MSAITMTVAIRLQSFARLNVLMVFTVTMSGCAIVTSQAPSREQPPSGMLYHLPKAVLPIELVAKGGALELRVQPSKQIADPQQRYLLKNPTNVFASNNVKVEWDSNGLLLSKLTMDSTDQSLNVLKEVAKAAVGLAEAAGAEGEVILASGDFDPDFDAWEGTNAVVMRDLHLALKRQLGQWADQCARKDAKKEDKPAPENCEMASQFIPDLDQGKPILQVSAVPMGGKQDVPAADCSIGLCYRGQQPFVLGLEVAGIFSRRTVQMLPNQSPAIALSLDSAPFVKTEYTVEFQGNGALKSVDTKRPSSALQLVSWPLDLYKAVLSATSELITLRIGAKTNEVDLAQKELDTVKALQRIADEMEAFNKGKNKTEGAGGGGGALMSIPLGRMKADPGGSLFPDGKVPTVQACRPGQPCPGGATSAVGR